MLASFHPLRVTTSPLADSLLICWTKPVKLALSTIMLPFSPSQESGPNFFLPAFPMCQVTKLVRSILIAMVQRNSLCTLTLRVNVHASHRHRTLKHGVRHDDIYSGQRP